jgi:hypothetical protein
MVKLTRALYKRNASIVEVNPTASSVLCCNSACYLLGANEQAKSALFYLLKYLTKDGVALSNSLSVLRAARIHIDQFPSVAADTGTTQRTGQHFLTRVVNSLSGQSEVFIVVYNNSLKKPKFIGSCNTSSSSVNWLRFTDIFLFF